MGSPSDRDQRVAELEAQVAALTGARDLLAVALEGMMEGVIVTDPHGAVMFANPVAAELVGADVPAGTLLAAATRAPEIAAFVSSAQRRGKLQEEQIETHDAGDRTLALYARPLGGDPARGLVTVLRDMSRFGHPMALRRDFVANVSHELRTPVTAIQGYAETLLRGTADPETARQFLEIIHRQSLRIGQLVTGLLRLAELEARPNGEAIREPVVLGDIAGVVADTMRTHALEAGVTLTLRAADDLRATGDPSGIEQVLLNLVENAIKYGKPNGHVMVSASRDGKDAVMMVADDGPGIEARHLPRLFERFYRIDEGRSRERGGSGLGLAIVKHLVESMGGRIDVRSRVAEGTTFRVRLPLSR